jgi:hypothetical protein
MNFSASGNPLTGARLKTSAVTLLFIISLFLWQGSESIATAAIQVSGAPSSAGKSDNVTVTDLTWSHTVGQGFNRVLIVGVSTYSDLVVPTARVSSVKYGTLELQRLGTSIEPLATSHSAVEMFILVAPPVGTTDITVTFNAVVINQAVGGAVSFTGVNQCSPTGEFAQASGSTGNPTVMVTSAPGEIVIDTVGTSPAAILLNRGAGQTQRWNGVGFFNNSYSVGAGSTKPGTSPEVSMSWSQTAQQPWAMGAVSLKPAPAVRFFDFDGDALTDISVWQDETSHNWVTQRSTDGQTQAHVNWGSSALGDMAVPGDYDGDAKTDIAVYRPSEGNWYIVLSSNGTVLLKNWGGIAGDVPVPGDYDGDGVTDVAIYRPAEGNWYVLKSTGGIKLQQWGAATDRPVAADYDGDGKTDIAVFRPDEGNWYIINSLSGTVRVQSWGQATDVLVQGDYDGDGRTDLAVWRPAEGNWYVINSCTNTVTVRSWGAGALADVPVPGDYDGDARVDMAVWRPAEGNWYIFQSSDGTAVLRNLGSSTDNPVPSAYIR